MKIKDALNKTIKCKPFTYDGEYFASRGKVLKLTKLKPIPRAESDNADEGQPMQKRSTAYRAMHGRPLPSNGSPFSWDE